MTFYDQLLFIKGSVQKKLACCATSFIDQEVINAQLRAIGDKLDDLELRLNGLIGLRSDTKEEKKKIRKEA